MKISLSSSDCLRIRRTCDMPSLNKISELSDTKPFLIPGLPPTEKEVRMLKYVINNNGPNQTATIHLLSCSDLGPEPLRQTTSSKRTLADDGLKALKLAAAAKNLVLCGHCLNEYRDLLAKLRRR